MTGAYSRLSLIMLPCKKAEPSDKLGRIIRTGFIERYMDNSFIRVVSNTKRVTTLEVEAKNGFDSHKLTPFLMSSLSYECLLVSLSQDRGSMPENPATLRIHLGRVVCH